MVGSGKTEQPYCNSVACGRDSDRIGFDATVRFGSGKGTPDRKGQNYEVGSGRARCNDVFIAPVGGNLSWKHPAAFPELLADQMIETFSREGELVVDHHLLAVEQPAPQRRNLEETFVV